MLNVGVIVVQEISGKETRYTTQGLITTKAACTGNLLLFTF
jgi:hypothetical protein